MRKKVNRKFYDDLVKYVETSGDCVSSHGMKVINYHAAKLLLNNFNKFYEIMETVKVINLSNNPLPKYETKGAAGMDLRADFSRITPGTL